jgi:DNA-directed RNA polymerase specialized sigma24 family protein
MVEAHAHHLFDYCYSLLADRARATRATQVTLIAAHSLARRLKDAGRMRAFVLAMGRRECLTGGQGLTGTAGPNATRPNGAGGFAAALAFVDQADDEADTDVGELALSERDAPTGPSLRAALQALANQDREILDLLYRHDVSITDLAPLLGVPAASVPGMLAAAKSKFAARASETGHAGAAGPASPDLRAEQLSAVRLVSLRDSVRQRTARAVADPDFPAYREALCARAEHLGPDGFPVQAAATLSNRNLLMASALMAALLLAPAAAGGAVYAAVSTSTHVVEHHHSTASTPGGPAAGRANSWPRSHGSRRHSRQAR